MNGFLIPPFSFPLRSPRESLIRAFVTILFVFLLAGCVARLSPSGWGPSLTGVDFGAYPTDYESIIKTWYHEHLKDPESARFEAMRVPEHGSYVDDRWKHLATYGYALCARVNAKNSFGGYTGGTTRWFLIRDGQVIRTRGPVRVGRRTIDPCEL